VQQQLQIGEIHPEFRGWFGSVGLVGGQQVTPGAQGVTAHRVQLGLQCHSVPARHLAAQHQLKGGCHLVQLTAVSVKPPATTKRQGVNESLQLRGLDPPPPRPGRSMLPEQQHASMATCDVDCCCGQSNHKVGRAFLHVSRVCCGELSPAAGPSRSIKHHNDGIRLLGLQQGHQGPHEPKRDRRWNAIRRL